MEKAPLVGLGWVLLLLGAASELFAWLAHVKAADFAPGIFTALVWVMIAVAPIPMLIGLALVFRRRLG